MTFFSVSELIGCNAFAQKIALVTLSLLVLFQAFLILSIVISPDETVKFYDKLAKKRTDHPQFVESYRHMREHGNSVLIVLGEFFLTFCLWEIHPSNSSESSVLLYFGVILAIWLIPSGLVWMVGTQLERHLTERN
jgi:magnesium-transporting ATPase (P-type)